MAMSMAGPFAKLLDLRHVHRPDAGLETLGSNHADDAQALRSHRLHMLRPAVDGDDIVRGCSEMRSDIAADGAGADDCDAFAHGRSPTHRAATI